MAMVRALGHALPEHDGRNLDHFSSGAHGAGDRQKQRRKGGCAGGDYLDCQRSGPIPVGMGLGFHRAAPRISYHVRDPVGDVRGAFARAKFHGARGFCAFIVLFCYGGGFGTMPAYAADYFGSANVGSIYGLMLTAWGFAAVCGPTLIARVRQSTGHYTQALEMIAGIMLVSAVLPFVIRPPKRRNAESANAPI